eukprot:scaffold200378_cov16-Prasinocladus_malaysianus.AAC.1
MKLNGRACDLGDAATLLTDLTEGRISTGSTSLDPAEDENILAMQLMAIRRLPALKVGLSSSSYYLESI